MYLSHQLVSCLVNLEKVVSEIEYLGTDKLEKLHGDIQIQELIILAKMIELDISSNQSEQLISGEYTAQYGDFRDKLLRNLVSALQYCEKLAKNNNIVISSDKLLELNNIIAQGVAEDWQLRYRLDQDQISLVYEPYASSVNAEYRQLAATGLVDQLLVEINEFELSRFYRISILIFNLLQIHPFVSFNKLTICMIFKLFMDRVLPAKLHITPLLKFFLDKDQEIISILRNQEVASAEVEWHVLVFNFMRRSYTKAIADNPKLFLTNKQQDVEVEQPFLDLNKRQLKILKYLQTIPTVKREDYVEMMNVSPMTAYRDLNELLENKLIRTIGRGRGTKYVLANK